MKAGDIVVCMNWTAHPGKIGQIIRVILSEDDIHSGDFLVLVDGNLEVFTGYDIRLPHEV